uniref:Uncharacterized protein n=1 Tax=Glossina brevipalpis TaxID=37001 RepID=A0A1A9W9M1_9MUSC
MRNLCKLFKSLTPTARQWSPKCNLHIHIEGSWEPPPICGGRKIEEPPGGCAPCAPSCGGAGACPEVPSEECKSPSVEVKGKLRCCTDKGLTRGPCEVKKKKKKKVERKPFKSMWATLPDYRPNCEITARTDDTLYHVSDKKTRKYQQTWKPCPKKKRKQKICCFDCSAHQLPKSTATAPVNSACEQSAEKLKIDYTLLQQCMEKSTSDLQKKEMMQPCRPKIKIPCCQPVRKNNKCQIYRGLSGCKKQCAPYPSYSECTKPPKRKLHPIECRCLDMPMVCEGYDFLKIKEKFNLPPPMPAWPPERPK